MLKHRRSWATSLLFRATWSDCISYSYGDSNADIVVGALQGVSHVKGFSGLDDSELASFFAYEGSLGGVSVAVLDADGDGRADIGTGSRVGSHLKAFRPSDLQLVDSFISLEDGFPGGVNLS